MGLTLAELLLYCFSIAVLLQEADVVLVVVENDGIRIGLCKLRVVVAEQLVEVGRTRLLKGIGWS